jgi:hypothetical protein
MSPARHRRQRPEAAIQRARRFLLKLEGRGDAADIRHLRAILKTLLRKHGFRCLECMQERRP